MSGVGRREFFIALIRVKAVAAPWDQLWTRGGDHHRSKGAALRAA